MEEQASAAVSNEQKEDQSNQADQKVSDSNKALSVVRTEDQPKEKTEEATGDAVGVALGQSHQQDQEVLPASDLIVSERNKRDLQDVARSIMTMVEDKIKQASGQAQTTSSNPNNDPLTPLYQATKTSTYEELVTALGNFLPNFAHPGEGTLDVNHEHVDKPGVMTFGVPDYAWFGYGSQRNDYSNVSYMRLVTDKSFVRSVADHLFSLLGTPYKGTKTNYMPENKALAFSGGFPFYAVIQSSNGSLLSPTYYFGQLNRTLQAITNLFTFGLIDNELNNNYNDGQYGIYLRMEVPDGTDPDTFVKTLNLNKTKFGAQMDFNVNLSIDEILNRIPGVRTLVSSSLGVPISGYAGSIVDYLLGSVIDQVNEKYGTDLKVRGVDSPFYPITLYPKDIKTNVQEDPKGIYFLVRGAELKDFDSLYLQAKILLTKFFMNALSWGGNIVGGAYGYLNFDIDQYPGNLSSKEMKKLYGSAADSKVLAGFADNSPFKILTRGQLPPQPGGQLQLAWNSIDANAMLSKESQYYDHGDLGRDLAVDRNKIHDNQMVTDSITTWRAYISPFDQMGDYNQKAIASSVAEFEEVKGVDRVLPGRDLDHRELVFSAGESFYQERDRFDRVIDYFDGKVLLDGQGVHPTDKVKNVHLVKSLDPEGRFTKESDFAIYDRAFTVYYSGDMELANGKRIALRPTKVSVTQKSGAVNHEQVNNRIQAYGQVAKQARFIQKTVENLTPKLADYHVANVTHLLHERLVVANQAIELAKTKEECAIAADVAIKELVKIQEEAVRHHDLDTAIQQSARQLGQVAVVKAAFNEKINISDASELAKSKLASLHEQVQVVKENVVSKLAKLVQVDEQSGRLKRSTGRSLSEILTEIERETAAGIREINNIYIPTAIRDKAVAELTESADERKQVFEKIAFVDPVSLKR
ncbi:hypothetical protein [Fructobacillus papyrifericola]|uniref:Uncharacterized protein n=1 Tax=Fructobacillus papyrifericola TaxID=2713172 RepID=A0ABS5QRX5_9LACO|nr:hypothetical protein [Fructobacillus papyrifericola]MBS9335876.1 hypothetical protein [Fructobacillus papyrifericola]